MSSLPLVLVLFAGEPTYYQEALPVLERYCAGCHRQGGPAPFSVLSYERAAGWRRSIAEAVQEGRMPPWHAERGYGEWANDRSLPPQAKQALLDWINGGCQMGSPVTVVDSPPPEWEMGRPDLIVEAPREEQIPARGVIPIRRVQTQIDLERDAYVVGAEVKAGKRRVVHHVKVFVKGSPGGPTTQDNILAWYAPGEGFRAFPAGCGFKLPRHGWLEFELHYTATGKPERDRSSIGLRLVYEQPARLVKLAAGLQMKLRIPPGEANHREATEVRFERAARLLSVSPHAHWRGKSFRFTLLEPGKEPEVLLNVPRYDFNWQTNYVLRRPREVGAGSRVVVDGVYDNSANNRANPDPTREVTWGDQSWEEMLAGVITYTDAEDGRRGGQQPGVDRQSAMHGGVQWAVAGLTVFASIAGAYWYRRGRRGRGERAGADGP